MFEHATHNMLYQDVISQISKMILEGKIKKGDLLPSENALCAQFNVSRTTIRAALRVLSDRKIITTVRGKGSIVIADNFAYLKDGLREEIDNYEGILEHASQVRLLLEPKIAFEAALCATPTDIRELTLINDDCREKIAKGILTSADMRAFHIRLAAVLKNPVLSSMITSLISMCDAPEETTLVVPNPSHKSQDAALKEHELILDAIKRRKCEDAYFYMRGNINTFHRNCLDEF